MPRFDTATLLTNLKNDVQTTIEAAKTLLQLDNETLNTQPATGKWSVAQVIEHLNSYNRYYLPEIAKALKENRSLSFNPVFKAGWFGDYFTNMMLPKQGGKIANKMNAPKDHRPDEKLDGRKVVETFISEQQRLLTYLDNAAKTDMGRIKVPISISRFIKLKLGDTFRFLIAHQQRHFIQANNVLVAIEIQPGLAMGLIGN